MPGKWDNKEVFQYWMEQFVVNYRAAMDSFESDAPRPSSLLEHQSDEPLSTLPSILAISLEWVKANPEETVRGLSAQAKALNVTIAQMIVAFEIALSNEDTLE